MTNRSSMTSTPTAGQATMHRARVGSPPATNSATAITAQLPTDIVGPIPTTGTPAR